MAEKTKPRLIEHIGVLVDDLETAIARWESVMGYTFGPICRYRTDSWIDSSQAGPHHHDARLAFSNEGPPRIELMEVTGSGTHGPSQRGIHHFGIVQIDEADELRRSFIERGIAVDGASLDEAGRAILWFTDPEALDGIRLEFVGVEPQPAFSDDGDPLVIGPDGEPVFD
ncbi:VOC family protein [Microbacterium sp. LMC-P-041]|uniref:VOC family protein n=1 Tax=Microbacterium sp. LMC-P-041 TaxID=3040293 RepID=UPI002554D3CD|nr:VOC family protein [Microbacterium sp. LMC-P-041]